MSDREQTQPYSVLLVDDNPDDTQLCLHALKKAQLDTGIEIRAHAVNESSQAIALLNGQRFDAVFLDVDMPPPNGIELARWIRGSAVNRSTVIVMLTGSVDRGVLSRAYEAGASFFLAKPAERMQLRRLIQITRESMDRERRRFCRVRVECKSLIEFERATLTGKTLDVSLSGALVQAGRAFPVGSLVELGLVLPSAPAPLKIAARVARIVGDDCMGLQFERFGKTESAKLSEFLVPLIAAAIGESAPELPPAKANSR